MKKTILISLLAVLAFSCAKDSDVATDKANFTRIYDNNKFDASYYPIDVKQTPDGGFLILGGRRLTDSNFSGIYLMKVDQLGAYVSDLEVTSDKVAPIGPLLEANNKYYFFSMTPVGLQTQISEMDADGAITKTTAVGGSYPAAAFNDNGSFLLLRYDNGSKESVLAIVNPTGSVSKSKGFTVGAGDGVEAPIIQHYLRTGRQFPFQVGKTASGQYFFNGFYNYTFSLVFTDLSAKDPLGVVQGQQDDGGLSYIMPLDGIRYASARFNFGDNYLLPNATLNSTGTTSSVDLGGNNLPELANNATVKIISATVNSKEIALYGSNTRSKQISLYGYEKATGKFLGSRYLGFSNPFEIAAMITTTDGGLAVCGTTYVAGRFPRICLFKISKDELAKSFK
ncbi:MAG: hypothetical protein ACKVOQ_05625 [Cyclobacteriaceae bacterium]